MTDLETSAVLRHAPGVLHSELDGEAVLLDPASGRYFGLNPIGTAIWTLLDGETSLEAIHRSLEARYEVSSEVLWRDLAALVDEFLAKGLVERVP